MKLKEFSAKYLVASISMIPLEKMINSNLPIFMVLDSLYGVGRTMSVIICKRFGVSPQAVAKNLPDERIHTIWKFLDEQVLLGDDVKKVEINTIRKYNNNNSVKGRRVLRGLPIRGQRTRANAQTPKRRRFYFQQLIK